MKGTTRQQSHASRQQSHHGSAYHSRARRRLNPMLPSFSKLGRHLRLLPLVLLPALGLQAQPSPPAKPKPKAQKPPIVYVTVDYELADALPGLKFEMPLGVVTAPSDRDRLFVVEKTGRVQMVSGLGGTSPQKSVFLDLTQPHGATLVTEGECGVLGLAFPPDHAQSGRCFVYYSLRLHGVLHQRLSRFQVSASKHGRVDASTEQPLFTQKDEASNHNGGDLAFGPDGYLYVSTGDGGAANDKFDNARHIHKGFHAAILRLDVDKRPGNLPPHPHPAVALGTDSSAFYSVPADNPFIGKSSHHGLPLDPRTVRTEIFATGLRNPWRMSFDPATGRLFCADVGQNLYEEINLIVAGGDYGWPHREATHPFHDGPGGPEEPQDFHPVAPIFEYPHTVGLSVTGGVVYHGDRLPAYRGRYLFADYATGRVIALHDEGAGRWRDETLAQEPGIAGIGLHPATGEVLFANMAFGQIKQLRLKAGADTRSR